MSCDLALDIIDERVEFGQVDVSFRGGAHQSDEQLIAVKRLDGPIAFNNFDGVLASLERGETISARTALTPALDGIGCILRSRINDARVIMSTAWTTHIATPLPLRQPI